MAAGKSVEDILSGAKQALKHADEFSKSIPSADPTPTPAPVLNHEYAKAPYALVKKKSPSYSLSDEAEDVGKGLKARAEMEKKARQ
jgi:hypothetical protein